MISDIKREDTDPNKKTERKGGQQLTNLIMSSKTSHLILGISISLASFSWLRKQPFN
jgi:hypothetical protein